MIVWSEKNKNCTECPIFLNKARKGNIQWADMKTKFKVIKEDDSGWYEWTQWTDIRHWSYPQESVVAKASDIAILCFYSRVCSLVNENRIAAQEPNGHSWIKTTLMATIEKDNTSVSLFKCLQDLWLLLITSSITCGFGKLTRAF